MKNGKERVIIPKREKEKMLRIAVVDDDENDACLLSAYFKRYSDEETGEKADIKLYTSGENFVKDLSVLCDIVFLDIDMPEINGIETAKKLREINQDAAVVFVTNMAQYALQGYEVNAMDFFVKPVTYSGFKLKMKKIMRYVQRNSSKKIALRISENEIVNAESSDIIYVEVMQHYLIYHMKDGKKYRVRGTITEAEGQLSPYCFARCSKSFVVNMKYISDVRGGDITVMKEILPLTRTHREKFMDKFRRYIGGMHG